jgi:hypothetical protein
MRLFMKKPQLLIHATKPLKTSVFTGFLGVDARNFLDDSEFILT